MKSIKSLASAALLLAVSMGFTSCSDDDDNKAFVVSFNDPSITMDSKTSAWADVMKEVLLNFTTQVFHSVILSLLLNGVVQSTILGTVSALPHLLTLRIEVKQVTGLITSGVLSQVKV